MTFFEKDWDLPCAKSWLWLLVLLVPATLQARPPQSVIKTKPPQSVIKFGCPCGCGCTDCKCVAGECGGAACTCASKTRTKTQAKASQCPCGCSCGADCKCNYPGECGDAICSCGHKALSLNAGIAKAVKENKPILLWIREVCPSCEHKMPNYIHIHLTEYDGYSGLVEDCCVIVGKPNAQGSVDRVATLPGIPTVSQVQAALAPQIAPAQPMPQPMLQYAPPPMMFQPMMGGFGGGGFGGGFGGGGCAGGG